MNAEILKFTYMPKTTIENPHPDEKVCFNCKYMSWSVGIGQGARCMVDKKEGVLPPMLPSRWYTCNKFEKKP